MAWPEIHQLGTLSVLFGFMYQLVLLIVSKTIDSAAGHDATLCVFAIPVHCKFLGAYRHQTSQIGRWLVRHALRVAVKTLGSSCHLGNSQDGYQACFSAPLRKLLHGSRNAEVSLRHLLPVN